MNKVNYFSRCHNLFTGYSDTTVIKLLAGVLLSLLLFMVSPFGQQIFIFCLPIVWLSLLFPERVPLILGIGSIFCFLVSLQTTGNLIFGVISLDIPGHWMALHYPQLTIKPAGFAIRIFCEVIIALLFWLALRSLDGRAHKYKVAFAFVPLLALCGAFDFFHLSSPFTSYWLLTAVTVWNRLLWSFLLLSCVGLSLKQLPLQQIWILFPPWGFTIPLWQPVRVDKLTPDFAARAREMRMRTIYFSLCGLAILILDQKIFHLLFLPGPGTSRLPNPWTDSTIIFLENVPSQFAAWLLIIFAFLRFVVVILGVYLTIPFLLLMNSGIPAVASWQSPYLAKSFHEFSTRILGFYVQINMLVFYLPIASSLRFLGTHRRLRHFLTAFLSTFLLALIFHFLRFLHVAANIGFLEMTKIYFSTTIIYDLAVSLITGLSVLWVSLWRPSRPHWIVHAAKLSAIIVAYSLLMTLYYNPQSETPRERLRLWTFLFTGQRPIEANSQAK